MKRPAPIPQCEIFWPSTCPPATRRSFLKPHSKALLLFLVLISLRLIFKRLPHGLLTGLFFVLYAIGRITAESFREPDASLIYGFSRGQFYSFFMIFIGLAFLTYAATGGRKALDERRER